jgi:hypothetical protein
MTKNKKYFLSLSLFVSLFFSNNIVNGQVKNYNYLINCFDATSREINELEIEKIGVVKAISLVAIKNQEIGLLYFEIPNKVKKLTSSKLAELASNQHIKTWKNNSYVISNKKHNNDTVSIIDLRLHMKIESINMQVITVCDSDKIYAIISFNESDDEAQFDLLIANIVKEKCL